MDIQKKIRSLMEQRGWTEYRLAKEAKLSSSTVSNMFNRNNAPSIPTLELICNAFGITLSQFFLQEEDLEQFNKEEKQLLSQWNLLSPQQKQAIFALIDTWK